MREGIEKRESYPLTEAYLRAHLADFPKMIEATKVHQDPEAKRLFENQMLDCKDMMRALQEGNPEPARGHILSVLQKNVEIVQRDPKIDTRNRVDIMKKMLTYLEELST